MGTTAAPLNETPTHAAAIATELTGVVPDRRDVMKGLINNVPAERTVEESLAEQPVVEIVKTSEGEQMPDGTETPAVEGEEAAPVTEGEEAATPAAEQTPEQRTQAELEAGFDVGSGDALYRVRDKATGQFRDSPQDIVIELAMRDERTGEVNVYPKTVAEITRMARDGVAGNKVIDEVKMYRERFPQIQDELTQLQEQLRAQLAFNAEILQNEEVYMERAEEFRTEMSPERQLARIKAQQALEHAARERRSAAEKFTQESSNFHRTRIAPNVDAAMAVLPAALVTGKIAIDTAALLGPDNRIPPDKWPAYAAYIEGPFKAWVQAESALRDKSVQKQASVLSGAKKAIRDTGRAMQPVGVAPGASAAAEPPLPPPRNKQEVMDRMTRRPLPG